MEGDPGHLVTSHPTFFVWWSQERNSVKHGGALEHWSQGREKSLLEPSVTVPQLYYCLFTPLQALSPDESFVHPSVQSSVQSSQCSVQPLILPITSSGALLGSLVARRQLQLLKGS